MNPFEPGDAGRLVDLGAERAREMRRGRPPSYHVRARSRRGRCLPRDGAGRPRTSRSGSRYVAPTVCPAIRRDSATVIAAVVEHRAAGQVAAVTGSCVGAGTGVEPEVEAWIDAELPDLAALQQLGEPHRLGMALGRRRPPSGRRPLGPCRVDRHGCPGRGRRRSASRTGLFAGRRRLDGELHVGRDAASRCTRTRSPGSSIRAVVRAVGTLDAELGRRRPSTCSRSRLPTATSRQECRRPQGIREDVRDATRAQDAPGWHVRSWRPPIGPVGSGARGSPGTDRWPAPEAGGGGAASGRAGPRVRGDRRGFGRGREGPDHGGGHWTLPMIGETGRAGARRDVVGEEVHVREARASRT